MGVKEFQQSLEDAVEAEILEKSVLEQYRKTRNHIEKKADSIDFKIPAKILGTTIKDPHLEGVDTWGSHM